MADKPVMSRCDREELSSILCYISIYSLHLHSIYTHIVTALTAEIKTRFSAHLKILQTFHFTGPSFIFSLILLLQPFTKG